VSIDRHGALEATAEECVTGITGCISDRHFHCDINGLWAESDEVFEHSGAA
jgi:hypothetical protein